MTKNANPLKPSPSLLSKLGSILVHAEELTSEKGHVLDHYALKSLTDDPEVKDWLAQMQAAALLPLKR